MATADEGYILKEWLMADGTQQTNMIRFYFLAEGDVTYTPVFRSSTCTLTILSVDGGTATCTPQQDTYTYGDYVVLTATPADGYVCVGWQDANGKVLKRDNPLLYGILDDTTVSPIFAPSFAIDEENGIMGAILPLNNSAYPWALSASDNAITSTNNGLPGTSSASTLFITGLDEDVVYNLSFTYDISGSSYFEANNSMGYTLIQTSGTESKSFNYSIIGKKTEAIDLCYYNERESGDATNDIARIYNISCSEKTTISILVQPYGPGSVTGGGEYNMDDEVTLTATPDDGYVFSGWMASDGGQMVLLSSTNPFTFNANEDIDIYALFTDAPTQLTFADGISGTAEPYSFQPTNSWTAIEGSGYNFRSATQVTTSCEAIELTGLDPRGTYVVTFDYKSSGENTKFYVFKDDMSSDPALCVEGAAENSCTITIENQESALIIPGFFNPYNEDAYAEISNFTCTLKVGITLYDTGQYNTTNINQQVIEHYGKGTTPDVRLCRTFYCDGYYNSICLPFDLYEEDLPNSPLAGYSSLLQFSSATVEGTGSDRTLAIKLEPATHISSGHPYFIAWDNGDDIVNPVFFDASFTATQAGRTLDEASGIACWGTYDVTEMGKDNQNLLFLGSENKLYWPSSDSKLKGFRAYFAIPSDSNVKGIAASFTDDDIVTGIQRVTIDGQPVKFLRDGKVLIISGDRTFNTTGQIIK